MQAIPLSAKRCCAWIFNPRQIVGLDRPKDEEEEKGDGDVHHRSCDRDREFLRRLLRHARHAFLELVGRLHHDEGRAGDQARLKQAIDRSL